MQPSIPILESAGAVQAKRAGLRESAEMGGFKC
jgi:hypothetical protein